MRAAAGTPRFSLGVAEVPSIELLGVRIDCLHLADLLDRVRRAAEERERLDVMYVNIHCMNVAARDREYARVLHDADLVYCDGTGVRLGARLAGKSLPARMTGADWIHNLCHLAVRHHLRLFLLGSAPGIAERAAALLQVRHPGLLIAGTHPGYDAGPETVAAINAAQADILLVGMGTPTQEFWIDQNREAIAVPAVWAVGALFDFVSGKIPRGPHWLTDHGLEWLCRLAAEPRKLWRRYLLGNPLFLARIIRHYWF